MPKSTFVSQATETIEIFQRFFYLRSRFRAVMPENLAALKAHLDEARRDGRAAGVDFNLFYNVGVVLSREQEPVSMGELSRALQVPLSTATRIVDWLVSNGYAQRLPDPQDRRVVRVDLTGSGRAIYEEINAFIRGRVEKLLRRFTAEERASLIALMNKLLDSMEGEEVIL
jgi:DNA-binding MarR family transcriptional regulator